MDGEIDTLEQELLRLGRDELEMEVLLQDLRRECRAAGEAGQVDLADEAWALVEATRAGLAAVQAQVRRVEARLYGLRRRQRR